MAKDWFLSALVCAFVGLASAQNAHVYPDPMLRWNEVIVHLDGGVVRAGNDWRGEALFTVQGDLIFKGFSTSSFDLMYTVRDGKLCRGDSHFSSDVVYTFRGGRVYVGDSEYLLDLVYNLREEPLHHGEVVSVFKEGSGSVYDRVVSIQGRFTTAEWFALMLAQGLL